MRVRLLFAGMALASAPNLWADELEDVLGTFDELSTTVIEPAAAAEQKGPSPYGELTGSVALSASYNLHDHHSSNGTDWEGLSKLRSRLNLQYDNTLDNGWETRIAGYVFYDSVFSLRDRGNYSDQVLDDYEHEAEFQEVWVRGKLRENLDIKLGRQIVNWGRADSFRILDILNPLDNREPGLVDIEDLRLPVTMAKLDYYFDEHWSSSFIAVPEVRFSKNPPYGSDFEVLGAYQFKEHEPEHISDSSYAASLTGIYSGWDVSFHVARYWRDPPYLKPKLDLANFMNPLAESTLEHSRLIMIGGGGNYTLGSWLYKAELAWLDGIDYTTSSDQGVFGILPSDTTEKQRVDGLIGIEYFGIANTSFSVEVAHSYIPDFKKNMETSNDKQNSTGLAFRATHNMLNDRLDLNAVIFGNFGESGGGYRLDAEYDIRDALVLTGGAIFYEEGDYQPFNTYYDNDRLFTEIKYSF